VKRTKPLKRTAFKRKPGSLDAAPEKYQGFKPRKKPMGKGKVAVTRKRLMKAALASYFEKHGWEDGTRAFDQVTGLVLRREDAVPHHKTPESELRKAGMGVGERNQPEKFIITHWAVHKTFIHAGQMGRPEDVVQGPSRDELKPVAGLEFGRRFRIIENSPANATTNLCVDWSEQDRDDMNRFLGVNTNA
jgi:hypothetical protein